MPAYLIDTTGRRHPVTPYRERLNAGEYTNTTQAAAKTKTGRGYKRTTVEVPAPEHAEHDDDTENA